MIHRDARSLFDRAVEDLRERTLDSFDCTMAKLIYLSSTRNYNTGHYSHHGMEFCYSARVAEAAIEACHRDVFKQLASASLRRLVDDLEIYLRSTQGGEDSILESWQEFEPYRMVVPHVSEPLLRALFISNVRAALAILVNRRRARRETETASSPPPSPYQQPQRPLDARRDGLDSQTADVEVAEDSCP